MGKLTTDQASRLVKNQARALVKSSRDFELMSANSARGLMMKRVFNDNRNTSGKSFGRYRSESYKARRRKRGRQVGRVDLNFSERLFRSIVVGKDGKGHALGVSSGSRSDKSGLTNSELTYHLEKRYGPTFTMSGEEVKKILKPINRELDKIIKNTKP